MTYPRPGGKTKEGWALSWVRTLLGPGETQLKSAPRSEARASELGTNPSLQGPGWTRGPLSPLRTQTPSSAQQRTDGDTDTDFYVRKATSQREEVTHPRELN